MTATTADRRNRRLAQGFLLTVCLASLIQCPYSKVEESFGIQAVHDLFYHGISPAVQSTYNRLLAGSEVVDATLPYDHLEFPGVVPRTFLGPLVLAYSCQFLRILLLPLLDLALYPATILFLARLLQLAATVYAWFGLAQALDAKTKRMGPGTWLLCVTACQFHLPFYASRLLANSLATIGTLHCYAYWLTGRIPAAATCLVAVTAIVRCDLLLLLFTTGLSWLFTRQLSVVQAVWRGVVSGLASLLATVPLDSLLWQRLTWPEGEVLYFNTVLNKSSDYGVSAWHWYFSSALPKALLLTILLVPLSILRLPEQLIDWERRWRERKPTAARSTSTTIPRRPWFDTDMVEYLLPAIGFVALYSFLGHKEVRFLFPALPLFNMAAAVGMARLCQGAVWPQKGKVFSILGWLMYAGGLVCLIGSLIASLIFVQVSRLNYPGGQALDLLVQHVQTSRPTSVVVHVDVSSAMTGVSLFGQRAAQQSTPLTHWTFEKAGYEETNQLVKSKHSYTHMLSESANVPGFAVVAVAQGNPRLDLRQAMILTTDAIYVLERDVPN